ncbi:hypothetical protein AB6A40_004811 [Gnathostoma spinigerum]|uniref:RUN domain-containing protein n=1 Tax=Gnathostoma spinigerum TaxID=75299 RepID=A0ABD6EFT3_9BILA
MIKGEGEGSAFSAAESDLSDLPLSATSDDDSLACADRWSAATQSLEQFTQSSHSSDTERLKELEQEQERLSNSLLALSTHFAQVQFRLKQISQADAAEKDDLLKGLHDFAFKGCTDINEIKQQFADNSRRQPPENGEVASERRKQQMELICRLKEQLEDLERFAYETGGGELPSNLLIAKQKAILDKLREKTKLNFELEKMSQTDLQEQVELAIKQLVNPVKAKERLVAQLQTQIVDLERFISFLQRNPPTILQPTSVPSSYIDSPKTNLFLKFVGCGSQKFQRNELKTTVQGNHYGDARARLELSVDTLVRIMNKYVLLLVDESSPRSPTTSNRDIIDEEVFERSEEEIVSEVRKTFCPALRSLLEHGMKPSIGRNHHSFPAFGCLSSKHERFNDVSPRKLDHIWDVIRFFYDTKCGRTSNDAPIRKLSQSFQLENVAGRTITSKQVLLTTIENILSSHSRLKRSSDAMWKAFVSAALNEKRLTSWIRSIFKAPSVMEHCYYPWAYVMREGGDCDNLLDRLKKFGFNLPVDLAVRPFRQMKDAF